ncbi:MAG: ATP-dependent zinc metalloprotease FtsH [Candidatus Magasanikbacteria bacterium GW2011_GWA2_45_39]|uniref:ATP-dependent zinc metalloprotease FtsH n=2 Tax=Candidatus Magasanikiibacteriota TaxID=1752731 RepID=A0A0G1QHJ5_9BACT|nr:MAG: ATP-dependent zinc metalloprotease FtsH [Candidatus Magasanikbacteria bacterium GW2011_GWA2_45_39]HBW74278.1 cell division protein FtsH [Candidatus Magasanikbacteria bacterium]
MSSLVKNFLLFILLFFLLALVMSGLKLPENKSAVVGMQTVVQEIVDGKVKQIEVQGDKLIVKLQDGTTQESLKEAGESVSTLLKNYSIDPEKMRAVEVSIKSESGWRFWMRSLLPIFAPILVLVLLLFFMTRQVQGINSRALGFGQAGAKQTAPGDNKNKVTFKDVAGVKEAKEELAEVVDFLKNSKRFVDMGAKIPKGVLLMGVPGTGKTLLAKAVAGEADVPFFHMSGSEFVEMFVGVGASRVRDLFKKAKTSAPAIVFIDELDAVGRRRGYGIGGSHDEREQTLNQILVEMDGFEPNSGVIVIAATNRPDVLDPALLRPGRFDRRVTVDSPDLNDREEIMRVHAVGKPLADDVSLREIAERTPGFTGADLANLLNEAAILTVRRNKPQISKIEILDSIEKVLLGPERRGHILSDKEKKITAYHEAGHALVAHSLPNADPVRKVSIISRGRAGGYTLKMPTEDKRFHSKGEFLDDLSVALGGFVAEQMIFGNDALSTGPSSDLRHATQLAKSIVTEYGMSDLLGPRTFGSNEENRFLGRDMMEQRDFSEKTAEQIDMEVGRLLKEAKTRAEKIIQSKRDKLELLVQELMQKETIEQGVFEGLMGAKEALKA